MKKDPGQNIVIIGCGNVAWHLAKHLRSLKGSSVVICNHKANLALNDFRSILKCKTVVGLKNAPPDADLYFICVSDSFIEDTAEQLLIKNPEAILIHTSGSMKLEKLGDTLKATGVFYPLQTFSKTDTVNWAEVPLIIEASTPEALTRLERLAKRFSKTVKILPYKERLKLHLAAVLVNNFANALYVAASGMVSGDEKNGNAISLLLPLIKQTTQKLETMNPVAAQTGPAKRHDEVVLKKHRDLLSKQPALKKLYKQLSKLIIQQQKNKHA